MIGRDSAVNEHELSSYFAYKTISFSAHAAPVSILLT